MIPGRSPSIDERDSRAVLAEFQGRRGGYLPDWNPPDKSAGQALAQVFSHLIEGVVQRLNLAPAKNRLAMLDLLGFRLVPAQSARAPIAFKLNDGAPDSAAPRGTQVAAPPPPGSTQQIVFETEEDIGVASAKLTQIVCLWPGRDQYIDHSATFQAGSPIVLFQALKLQPVPHIIYLAHQTLLAFAGKTHLEVVFELAQGSSSPLDVVWEYWDGEVWREFKSFRPSCLEAAQAGHDGTMGLSRSGSVRLDTDAGQTAPTTVNGVQSYWIRGRLSQALPPDPARLLPLADTVRLRTLINQGLELNVSATIAPSFAGSRLTVVDEGGTVLFPTSVSGPSPPVPAVTLTQTDDTSISFDSTDPSRWSLTPGKTYQVDVAYEGIIGTVFVNYNGTTSTAAFAITIKMEGLLPDKALFAGKTLDVTKSFLPLGQLPAPGAAFYFKQAEIFSKPGARVTLFVSVPPVSAPPPSSSPAPPTNLVAATTFSELQSPLSSATISASGDPPLDHTLNWEYWNGQEWIVLLQSTKTGTGSKTSKDFTVTEIIEFTVPNDMRSSKVNNEDGLWIRVRLVSGGYGVWKTITLPPTANPQTVVYIQPQPPIVGRFCFGYSSVQGPAALERAFTYNDFQYADQTANARWPGTKFSLFEPVNEVTPALYLGFDRALPVNNFGMYFDIMEQSGALTGPDFTWEYWNGAGWQKLVAEDETQALQLPGMVSVLAESDSQPLARFARPLYWLRARLKEDAPPNQTTINNIFPNAVWASQVQTITNQPLGASTGEPNQIFQFTRVPVLPDARIEVQELFGARANTEWRLIALDISGGDASFVAELESMLASEGTQTDLVLDKIRLKRDKNKIVKEVWVEWGEQENFYDSNREARDYVLDHATGRVFFGNGDAGMIPPSGGAIQAAVFRSGGGLAGNVASATVTQLLGAVSGVQAVTNVRPGEGGADGEPVEEFAMRAPQGLRNRGASITLADYEALAHEASAGVAVARAISLRDPNSITPPGWITLIIIPHSAEARPMPSFGLREEVRSYLEERAPAELAESNRIRVVGPTYLPIDVTATLAPKDFSDAGTVEQEARDALEKFLHPLYGGPAGQGWDLGRNVFISDIAAVLGDVEGVDYVEELEIFVNGALQDGKAEVPTGQIVVAGELKLNLIVAA